MTVLDADAALVGDSSFVSGAVVAYSIASAMAGTSTAVDSATMKYAVLSTFAGSSVANLNAGMKRQGTSAMSGSSVWSASADSDVTALSLMSGNANLLFDPTKITIVNFSRGPQIPASAKPVTIPTIRISPPSPPSATYSVGSPPANRRKGL